MVKLPSSSKYLIIINPDYLFLSKSGTSDNSGKLKKFIFYGKLFISYVSMLNHVKSILLSCYLLILQSIYYLSLQATCLWVIVIYLAMLECWIKFKLYNGFKTISGLDSLSGYNLCMVNILRCIRLYIHSHLWITGNFSFFFFKSSQILTTYYISFVVTGERRRFKTFIYINLFV